MHNFAHNQALASLMPGFNINITTRIPEGHRFFSNYDFYPHIKTLSKTKIYYKMLFNKKIMNNFASNYRNDNKMAEQLIITIEDKSISQSLKKFLSAINGITVSQPKISKKSSLEKSIDDFEHGRFKTFSNTEDLFKDF